MMMTMLMMSMMIAMRMMTMMVMMAMLMLLFHVTMAHRFQRRQVTPASGVQIKSLDITERPIPDCQMSSPTNKKTTQTLR